MDGFHGFLHSDERQAPGRYLATWEGMDVDGRPVASGVYFGHLRAGDFQQTVRMTLVR